jgi:hypothetical protein
MNVMKVTGVITWTAAADALKTEMRLYNRLFSCHSRIERQRRLFARTRIA